MRTIIFMLTVPDTKHGMGNLKNMYLFHYILRVFLEEQTEVKYFSTLMKNVETASHNKKLISYHFHQWFVMHLRYFMWPCTLSIR